VFIFILELFMISVTQSQKYLECTFDVGDLLCKLIPIGTAPELEVISSITADNLSIDPLMPLSDVTSISKYVLLSSICLVVLSRYLAAPTVGNGSQCKLPYRLDSDSKEIYFCSTLKGSSNMSSCITEDNTTQECVSGEIFILGTPISCIGSILI